MPETSKDSTRLRDDKMTRGNDRAARRWKTGETANGESSDTAESSSVSITESTAYIKHTSTPIRRGTRSTVDETAEESSDVRKRERPSTGRAHGVREKHRERKTESRRKNRSGRRRSRGPGERSDAESDTPSTSEVDVSGRSRRRRDSSRGESEVPITEILRRSEENGRTRYEKPEPLPRLTTDKIYVQRGNGFSAVKIPGKSTKGEVDGTKRSHEESCPPIRAAIVAQRFWKSTGLVCQGILGGMGLMHFITFQVFYDASTEFLAKYSMISEIYANIFSLLVAICVVSTFDKFDLARLGVEHLREIYVDYGRTAIAVPLYAAIFCLHQLSSKTNDQLALKRYYNFNDSLWENVTNVDDLLDDLNGWQKLTVSKDILAVFAWLFVSLGTTDEAFLIHLESMEKYASDVRPAGQ